jgi:IS5 family transposase
MGSGAASAGASGSNGAAPPTTLRWRAVTVVERTFAWINQFRRLVVRYERHADLYEAFLVLAAALICFRALQRFCWAL